MGKDEKTSKSVASKAAKILRDPKSTKTQKSVAASALTQAPDRPKGTKLRKLLWYPRRRVNPASDHAP